MNAQKVKDAIISVIGMVGVLGLTGACIYLDYKYGSHDGSSSGYGPSYNRPDPDDFYMPRNSWSQFFMPQSVNESKILAIAENAKDYRYDSDKIRAAKDIYELASGDETVKQIAILALQDLSKSMTYDSDRNRIFRLIKEM